MSTKCLINAVTDISSQFVVNLQLALALDEEDSFKQAIKMGLEQYEFDSTFQSMVLAVCLLYEILGQPLPLWAENVDKFYKELIPPVEDSTTNLENNNINRLSNDSKNERRIQREASLDFMETVFGGDAEIIAKVKTETKVALVNALQISIDADFKALKVRGETARNTNLYKYQEELFAKVVKAYGSQLKEYFSKWNINVDDIKLYKYDSNGQIILEDGCPAYTYLFELARPILRKAFSEKGNSDVASIDLINIWRAGAAGSKESQIWEAYKAWHILNHFDSLLKIHYSSRIKANYFSDGSFRNKRYEISEKSEATNDNFRDSDTYIDAGSEISCLSKNIIETRQAYDHNGDVKLGVYTTFGDFLSMIKNIRDLFTKRRVDDTVVYLNVPLEDMLFTTGLSLYTQTFIQTHGNYTLQDLYSRARLNPTKYWRVLIDIFATQQKVLTDTIDGAGIPKSFFTLDLKAHLHSFNKGLFNNSTSVAEACITATENKYFYSDLENNYYSDVCQIIDSLGNVNVLLYRLDKDGIISTQNLQFDAIDNRQWRIKARINSRNTLENFRSLGQKYQLELRKDTKLNSTYAVVVLDSTADNYTELRIDSDRLVKVYSSDAADAEGRNVPEMSTIKNPAVLNAYTDFVSTILATSGFSFNDYDSIASGTSSRLINMAARIAQVIAIEQEAIDGGKRDLRHIESIAALYISSDKNPPRYSELSDGLNLFWEGDAATLFELAKFECIKANLLAASMVRTGDYSTLSTVSLSRLLGSLLHQIGIQCLANDSATKDFSVYDAFIDVYTALELYTLDKESVKVTDFNNKEFTYSNFIYDYLMSFVETKEGSTAIIGKTRNSIKAAFLPSINSDKGTIGRMLVDLMQKLKLGIDKNGNIISKAAAECTNMELKKAIEYEIGGFYKNLVNKIESDYNTLLNWASKQYNIKVNGEHGIQHNYIGLKNFLAAYRILSNRTDATDVYLLKLLCREYNKAHYNKPIELIDQIHYVEGKKGVLDSNKTLLANAYRYSSDTTFKALIDKAFAGHDFGNSETFWYANNGEFLKSLLDQGVGIDTMDAKNPAAEVIKTLFDNKRNGAKYDDWVSPTGKLVFGKFTFAKADGTSKTVNLTTKLDVINLLKDADFQNNIVTKLGKENAALFMAEVNKGKTLLDYMPLLLNVLGTIELNPELERYSLMDYLYTLEFIISTVGTHAAHPSKMKGKWGGSNVNVVERALSGKYQFSDYSTLEEEAARFLALQKRNVSFTAAMQEFLLGLLSGIPTEYRVAVIKDIRDTLFNALGDIDSGVKPYDGATFVNPFLVYLENYSLGSASAGINKKQFVHFWNLTTGTGGIIKTAGFGLTNKTILNSFSASGVDGKSIALFENLMRKMTLGKWRDRNGNILTNIDITKSFTNEDIEIVNRNIIFLHKNNVYRIAGFEKSKDTNNGYKITLEKAVGGKGLHGTRIGGNFENFQSIEPEESAAVYRDMLGDKVVQSNGDVIIDSNYLLWKAFGGLFSLEATSRNEYESSESSIKNVVYLMNNTGQRLNSARNLASLDEVFQFMKHSDIHYVATEGAVKQGAANINEASAYFDTETDLDFQMVKILQAGIQLDKEHHADNEDISMMTLVLAAAAHGGYTCGLASKLYKGLAAMSLQGTNSLMEPFLQFLRNGDAIEVRLNFARAIMNAFLKSLASGKLDNELLKQTAKLAILDIKEGRTEVEFSAPIDNPSIRAKFYQEMASFFTKNGIKSPWKNSVLAVMNPSFEHYKTYNGKMGSQILAEAAAKGLTTELYLLELLLEALENPFISLSNPDNIVKIQIGQRYMVQEVDGQWKPRYIKLPQERRKLINDFRKGNVLALTYDVIHGKNLGHYDYSYKCTDIVSGQTSTIGQFDSDALVGLFVGNLIMDILGGETQELILANDAKAKAYILDNLGLDEQQLLKAGNLTAYISFALKHGDLLSSATVDEIGATKALSELSARFAPNTADAVDTLFASVILTLSELQILAYLDQTASADRLEILIDALDTLERLNKIKTSNEGREFILLPNEELLARLTPENLNGESILDKALKGVSFDSNNRLIDFAANRADWLNRVLTILALNNVDGFIWSEGRLKKINRDSLNVEACEVVVSKTFASLMGLRKNDQVDVILKNPDFFYERIKENLQSQINDIDSYTIELKLANGKHMYLVVGNDKVHEKLEKGNWSRAAMPKYTDSDGVTYRVNQDGDILYKINNDESGANGERVLDQLWVKDDIEIIEVSSTEKLITYLQELDYMAVHIAADSHSNSENLETIILIVNANCDSHAINPYSELLDSNKVSAYNVTEYCTAISNTLRSGNLEGTLVGSNADAVKISQSIKKHAKHMYVSFLQALNVIASRTPAQSMQSYMPMRIVGFVDEDVNNAYVSTMQIWLLGSDYDIDAVNIAFYGIGRNGLIAPTSCYTSYETVEELNETLSIYDLPTGSETVIRTLTNLNWHINAETALSVEYAGDLLPSVYCTLDNPMVIVKDYSENAYNKLGNLDTEVEPDTYAEFKNETLSDFIDELNSVRQKGEDEISKTMYSIYEACLMGILYHNLLADNEIVKAKKEELKGTDSTTYKELMRLCILREKYKLASKLQQEILKLRNEADSGNISYTDYQGTLRDKIARADDGLRMSDINKFKILSPQAIVYDAYTSIICTKGNVALKKKLAQSSGLHFRSTAKGDFAKTLNEVKDKFNLDKLNDLRKVDLNLSRDAWDAREAEFKANLLNLFNDIEDVSKPIKSRDLWKYFKDKHRSATKLIDLINKYGWMESADTEKEALYNNFKKAIIEFVDKHNLFFVNKVKNKVARDLSLQTFQIHNIRGTILSPINQPLALQPVDKVTDKPKSIAKLSKITAATRTKGPANPAGKGEAIKSNLVGKVCIALSANGLKGFFALTLYINEALQSGKTENLTLLARSLALGKDGQGIDLYVPGLGNKHCAIVANALAKTGSAIAQELKNQGIDLTALNSNKIDGALLLSALLSLSTDNAKELCLSKINADSRTIGLYLYGTIIGLKFEDIAAIMMSEPAETLIEILDSGNRFVRRNKLNKITDAFKYLEEGPEELLSAILEKRWIGEDDRESRKNNSEILQDFFKTILKNTKQTAVNPNNPAKSVEIDYANCLKLYGYNTMSDLARILALLAWRTDVSLENKLAYLDLIADTYMASLLSANKQLETKHRAWRVESLKENFKNYFIQVSKVNSAENAKTYMSIKNLAFGASELRRLTGYLGINLGLKVDPIETINNVRKIERACVDAARDEANHNYQLLLINSLTKGESAKHLSAEKLKVEEFSIKALLDPAQRETICREYDKVRHSFNVLRVITELPHYYLYISDLACDYEIDKFTSRVFNSIDDLGRQLLLSLGLYQQHDVDNMYKGLSNFYDLYTLSLFLLTLLLMQFTTKSGCYVMTNAHVPVLINEGSDTAFTLGSIENNATFKRWMENEVIPALQNKYSDNKFLADLSLQILPNKYRHTPTTAYSLDINMLPRTDLEKAALLSYKVEFNKLINKMNLDNATKDPKNGIKTYNIDALSGLDALDLFSLYTLIAYNGKPSLNSLVPILTDFALRAGVYKDYLEFQTNVTKSMHSPIEGFNFLFEINRSFTVYDLYDYVVPTVSSLALATTNMVWCKDGVDGRMYLWIKLKASENNDSDNLDINDDGGILEGEEEYAGRSYNTYGYVKMENSNPILDSSTSHQFAMSLSGMGQKTLSSRKYGRLSHVEVSDSPIKFFGTKSSIVRDTKLAYRVTLNGDLLSNFVYSDNLAYKEYLVLSGYAESIINYLAEARANTSSNFSGVSYSTKDGVKLGTFNILNGIKSNVTVLEESGEKGKFVLPLAEAQTKLVGDLVEQILTTNPHYSESRRAKLVTEAKKQLGKNAKQEEIDQYIKDALAKDIRNEVEGLVLKYLDEIVNIVTKGTKANLRVRDTPTLIYGKLMSAIRTCVLNYRDKLGCSFTPLAIPADGAKVNIAMELGEADASISSATYTDIAAKAETLLKKC